ncbi:MAG: hypothetical protein C0404_04820 [Verrucomicrobia bacterium]|nr:hypothetical protein [Verrucomicrobiota bacterium]
MTKPLKWSIDWAKPSFKERLLMGCPLVATEDRVYADIVRQLSERTESDLLAWNKYQEEVRLMAGALSEKLKAERIWPSALFLPDDPADIPLGNRFEETDKWDFLPAVYSIVEKDLGIKMDAGFWDGLSCMTYVQAVEQMIRRKAEQAGSGSDRQGTDPNGA